MDGKKFRRLAKNKKVLQRKVNQLVKQHNRFAPIFMFGVEIPRDPKHARILDQQNQNRKWQDAEYAEIQQLMDYEFANDLGPGDQSPVAHKRI